MTKRFDEAEIARMFGVSPDLVTTGATLSALEPFDLAAMEIMLRGLADIPARPDRLELGAGDIARLSILAARPALADPPKTAFGLRIVEDPDLPAGAIVAVYPDGRTERLR